MKSRFLALLCALCVVIMTSMVACSSDDSPPAQAGNGGSSASGSGGTAQGGSSGTAGASGAPNGWKKGVVGTSKGVVRMASGAGRIQGFSVNNGQKTTGLQFQNSGPFNNLGQLPHFEGGSMKPMDLPGDGGDPDADMDAGTIDAEPDSDQGDVVAMDAEDAGEEANPDADQADSPDDVQADITDEAGVPDTTLKTNPANFGPDFTVMWVPRPPFETSANNPIKIPPTVAVVQPDGSVATLQPFPDWNDNTDFVWNCLGSHDSVVNGNLLRAYGGFSIDMADCGGRHFLISNMTNKVWEIKEDGSRTVFIDNLPGASAIECDQDALIISALPQYDQNAKAIQGVVLKRVALADASVTDIVTLPITPDFADATTTAICGTFPGTPNGIPVGMKIPFAKRADGTYLIADTGARIIYSFDPAADGGTLTTLAVMDRFTVSAIMAPNEIIYTVEPPVVAVDPSNAYTVARGAVIKAFDGQNWIVLQELSGYEQYVDKMSNQYINVPCPAGQPAQNQCYQPSGGFYKLQFGTNPILYLVDPIIGELDGIPLDTGTPDAGTEDAGGSGGSSGAGGESGSGGSAGADPDASDDASTD